MREFRATMLGFLALWSLFGVALTDRAAVVQHSGLVFATSPSSSEEAEGKEVAGEKPDPAADKEAGGKAHEGGKVVAEPEAKPGKVSAEPETSKAGGGIKELEYDSMSQVSKNMKDTMTEMTRQMTQELTVKADKAIKAGTAYSALLKEQYAGHVGFETGIKTFRSAVSDQHSKDTKLIRKSLQSGTDGALHAREKGESMLTTENEADLLQQARAVEDDSATEKEESGLEKAAQASEKDYDPKALHVFLRWKKDVDLDLHLHAPNSKEVDSAFNKHSTHQQGENFIVKAGMNHQKKDGWYFEDISSAPGVLLPKGRYHAWATYASGVKGESPTAPNKKENEDVQFEAEFKLGDEKKMVKDSLKWQQGREFSKIKNSMMVFDFEVKGDNVIAWDDGNDIVDEEKDVDLES